MEIKEVTKGLTRDGLDRYYFIIENGRGLDYEVALTVCDEKVIEKTCSCLWGTWEISRKVKTYKDCKHIKFCLNYLYSNNSLQGGDIRGETS